MLEQGSELTVTPPVAPLDEVPDVQAARVVLAPATVRVRVTNDPRRLEAWALTLTSRGISSLFQYGDDIGELHVAFADFAAAQAELDESDAEERERQRAALTDAALEQRPISRHATGGALLVASLLLAFFAVTGPRAAGNEWFA
ncbi:MAG: hypothetical protein JWN04_3201, partial [Myxococcaceae bacterium]|nr:hypothetical protein [Myxococcaceae bacterium]